MRIDIIKTLTKPMTEPEWIIEKVIPRGSFIILAGEAGAGKTVLSQHIAICGAAQLPFLGAYPTHQTKTLYIDEENGLPDLERYWQRTYHGLGCPPVDDIISQLQVEHFSMGLAWETSLAALVTEFKPGLIVVDTATPALQVQDENDNAEASRKIQRLRAIQQLGDNATLLVLKHEKTRDETSHRRTIRGAKTWLGAVDIVMYLSLGRGGSGAMRHTFLRADKPRAFGLDHVIEIIPSWAADTEPRGYRLRAVRHNHPEES